MTLYHFTARENLQSILKHGLLCIPVLEKSKIKYKPNSNEISRQMDKSRGLENYVRLCKSKEHPMKKLVQHERRVDDIVWLKVSEIVIDYPKTLFCETNANKSGVKPSREKNVFLNSIDNQAEVLVFQQVPNRFIEISNDEPSTVDILDEVPF